MYGRTVLADCLPRLRNYAEALQRYNATVPLRKGRDEGLVPLGDNRRYKRSQMLKVDASATADNNGYIICRYWSRDAIKFYENGEVRFDIGEWHTPTTLMFLQGVFGPSFERYKGKIYYNGGRPGYYYINPVEGLRLDAQRAPVNPMPESSYVLNRAKWKAITNRFKPFVAYAQDMARVIEPKAAREVSDEFKVLLRTYGGDYWEDMVNPRRLGVPYISISQNDIRHNRGGNLLNVRREFMKRIAKAVGDNDPEQMYPMMFVLHACASESRWTGNGYITECNPERIKKYFHEILKFEFCSEVFDDVVQPLGRLVTDSNAKYFTKPRTT